MDQNSKSRSGEQPHYLPQEIIEEILPHLRVKSLLRFRCVSKSWCSLIESKNFIYKHLQNLKRREVILNKQSSTDVDAWWRPIVDPANNHLKEGCVVGCCNGVLCIAKEEENRFFLWNPATRISIELPKIKNPFFVRVLGFGWDEESGAHKVFVCMPDRHNLHRSIGKIYSSKTNSWKTIDCASLSVCNGVGVFVCGKIHWIMRPGQRQRTIECFDLKSETFARMELPHNGGWLTERGGRLQVVYYTGRENVLDVWAMEEYGNEESWVRLSSSYPIALDDGNGGGFTHLICYGNHAIKVCYQPYFCVESLVSPAGL